MTVPLDAANVVAHVGREWCRAKLGSRVAVSSPSATGQIETPLDRILPDLAGPPNFISEGFPVRLGLKLPLPC